VGESGCGKSTLGRVILQLYNQTAGSIRYRGATLNDYAPKYAFNEVAKIPQVHGTAEEIAKNYPEQVKLMGGLLLSGDLNAAAGAARENLNAVDAVNKAQTALQLATLKRTHYMESATELSASEKSALAKLETKITEHTNQLKDSEKIRDACDAKLNELRVPCKDKPGYQILEDMRDASIDLSRLNRDEMRRLRRDLQIVFQDPYSSLNQRFTVGQIISEALVAHNMFRRGTRQLEEFTLQIMDKCGLQNYFLHRYPHQFSGGQRQRIGIARALALQPRFVVCDEAVSALDVSIQSQIINLLVDLKESSNLTYLFISHDLSTVTFISDRVGVMYLGNMVELGSSDEIFAEPLHPYTNVLLDAIPTTEEASKKELQIIEGDIPSPVNPPPGCKFHTRCRYVTDKCKQEVPEWRELRPKHFVACHYPIEKQAESVEQ
jgi:peptide/nickel transport system ATP-binding protein